MFDLARLTKKCTWLRKQTPTRRTLLPTPRLVFHHNRAAETVRMLAALVEALPVALWAVQVNRERNSPWPHLHAVLTSRSLIGAPCPRRKLLKLSDLLDQPRRPLLLRP